MITLRRFLVFHCLDGFGAVKAARLLFLLKVIHTAFFETMFCGFISSLNAKMLYFIINFVYWSAYVI